MKRPLALFCLSLITGIIAAKAFNSYIFILLTSATVGLVSFILLDATGKKRLLSAGIVLFYFIGAFHYLYSYNSNVQKYEEYKGEKVVIKGYIDSAPAIKGARISYIIRTEEIFIKENKEKLKSINGKVRLSKLKGDKENLLEYGREVTVSGKLNLPKGSTNPGGFDFRGFLSQSGVSATIFAQDRNINLGKDIRGNAFVKAGLFLRERIVRVIDKSLPSQQAGLLNGMLIGYREGLSEEVQKVFSDSGLTHIMAVSGANVAFIVFPLVFVFKKLRLKRKVANIIIINILLLFTFVTGFEPSVLRAVIMAIVILIGQVIEREAEVFTSLAFAAMLMLLYNPSTLFNIGFQLSFVATISLVLFYSNIKEKLNFKYAPEFITDVLAGTLAAQLGVIPITVFYFNKLSVVSVLSNLIVAPMVEFITILGSIMAVLGQIHIVFSKLIGLVNSVLLSFVLLISDVTAGFPFAVFSVTTPSLILVVIYYIVVIFLFWYKPKYKVKLKFKHYSIAVALLIIYIATVNLIPKGLEVVFLDVGQGDSAFIRTSSGKTVLIDAGGENMGESVVIPFLLDYGVERLDLVIGTHGHDDHILGLLPVLKDIKVFNLVIPDIEHKDEYANLLQLAEKKGVKIESCGKGDEIRLDDKTYLTVMHPDKENFINKSPLNNNSLVLKLQYKKVAILFAGDIEKEAESLLLEGKADINTDFLKIAHHGSSTSSTLDFIESARPYAGVISVGNNNFGHPSKDIIDLFSSENIEIFRTDQDGAIILKTYGKNINIKTMQAN